MTSCYDSDSLNRTVLYYVNDIMETEYFAILDLTADNTMPY